MDMCSNCPINANIFVVTKNGYKMECSRTSILFGASICVIEDGASFNKWILFSHKKTNPKLTCAFVLLLHFVSIHQRSVIESVLQLCFVHLNIVWIGEEPGTASFDWKWPRISKAFRNDFIIKFTLQSFPIVSSCFNVYKFERNIFVLCRLIFSRRT